jgi:hypothetical protein
MSKNARKQIRSSSRPRALAAIDRTLEASTSLSIDPHDPNRPYVYRIRAARTKKAAK